MADNQASRGLRPALVEGLSETQTYEAKFDELDSEGTPKGTARALVTQMVRIGHIAAKNDPRWKQLQGDQALTLPTDAKAVAARDARFAGVWVSLWEDVLRAYRADEWDTWEPPLDALFAKALPPKRAPRASKAREPRPRRRPAG